MESESPSSTPSCRLACFVPSSKPTSLLHLSSFVALSPRSSAYSATASRTRVLESLLETCHKIQRPMDQEDLRLENQCVLGILTSGGRLLMIRTQPSSLAVAGRVGSEIRALVGRHALGRLTVVRSAAETRVVTGRRSAALRRPAEPLLLRVRSRPVAR